MFGASSLASTLWERKVTRLDYPLVVEPLFGEGRMSDGKTPGEAPADVRYALAAWIEGVNEMRRAVSEPSRHLAMA